MKKRVLIYEDDDDIRQLSEIILLKEGYEVASKSTCETIVADVQNTMPDLILMDLWIPDIGGQEAIRLVKQETALKDIPVVIFSANDELESICKNVNANGFLKKPFDILHLKNIVSQHISSATAVN